MTRKSSLVALLVFLLFGTIIAAVLLTNQDQTQVPGNRDAIPTPTISEPQTDVSPSPSPSQAIMISGEIISVSNEPVGFMSARLVRVQESAGQTLLYVTTTTVITGLEGQRLTVNALEPGDQIEASGPPAEGGVLASNIRIVAPAVTPTPTRPLSPSPTPSP
jgi:hypothetical protein